MKFCPVVPEICRGQVHGARKERRITRRIIRNGAKTISLQTLFGRLNNIPEAVKNLLYQPAWAILVKPSEINMIPLIILNKTQSFITG
jgi:hypothetical protein